MTKKGHQEF